MRSESRCAWWTLAAQITALSLVAGCAASAGNQAQPATTNTTATTTVISASVAAPPPPAPPPRTVNWFDLDVGDCLADPPPIDPNVITVSLADCASPHQAEVYLRSPMAVNTALADVADRECTAGFTDYTGQRVGGSALVTTYLIDSNQNRTASNPDPSTVICLLQSGDGQPLTTSARR